MDQKNFIVAIVLSVLIIVGWQHFFQPAKPPVPPQTTSQSGTPQTPAGQSTAPTAPGAPSAEPAAAQILSRKEALAASPRVTCETQPLPPAPAGAVHRKVASNDCHATVARARTA